MNRDKLFTFNNGSTFPVDTVVSVATIVIDSFEESQH
jgi:hypothetical protein